MPNRLPCSTAPNAGHTKNHTVYQLKHIYTYNTYIHYISISISIDIDIDRYIYIDIDIITTFPLAHVHLL